MVAIKICGLTSLEDAQVALDAGADALGFVLYPKSPRAVTRTVLARIVSELGGHAQCVGVFVNTPAGEVRQTALDCGLSAVQLHGDECADDFLDMPVPVWRALRVEADGCRPAPALWPMAVRYVADAAVAAGYGGSGIKADWERAAVLAKQFPMMLAGGLTPGNVAAAIAQVHPLGVDVSSGVESAPGRKSHAAVRAFIAAARVAGA